ncbi:MAG: hypothetical protein HRU40_12055, partial [Saprospiraceae bacterium]|nr:hypothetical protein [Saprospiraceae bacterium]
TGPSSAADGSFYIYVEASVNGKGYPIKVAILNSPCFDLAGATAATFSFQYHMFGPDIGALRFQVSVNEGLSWQTIWQQQNNQGPEWKKAYVAFSDYQAGDVLQFRFLGTRGRGSQGDIAIDNISIYGLLYEGRPAYQYYVDADNDGYGNPNSFIFSCSPTPPFGYADRAEDCNDQDGNINPDAPEIPCDNIDNNCNGMDDDPLLPPPVAIGDTICSGESALLRAQPVSGKSIFWYTAPDDISEVPEFGVLYAPILPPNNTAFPQTYTFYAEETDFRCFSATKAPATVVVNPTPSVSFSQETQVCPGEALNLASLDIQDSRGTGAQLAFFSSPDLHEESRLPTAVVAPFSDTTFYFTMTTDLGCQVSGEIPIQFAPTPQLTIEPSADFTLCVESEQNINITPQDGNPPLSYTWSSGETSSSISIVAGRQPGQTTQYALTVTDQFGCTQDTLISVETISSISSIVRSIDNVTTCSGSDGAITITPQGGLLPFTYEWQGTNGASGRADDIPSNTYTIENLQQGAYRITVTDNSSDACAFRLRTSYVNGPDAEVRAVDSQPVSCAGANNGFICLDVIGNPAYQWSTGDTSACLDNVPGGYYAVTITEADCSTILDSLFIAEPTELTYAIESIPSICADTPDGIIHVTGFGGTPPYQISWSDGSTGSLRNNLLPGQYAFTITDQNGCSQQDIITLTAPNSLVVEAAQTTNVSCANQADGFIQLAVNGGIPPYQYLWNTGSTRSVIGALSPGTYTVTVTDFGGCNLSRAFTISEPNPLQAQLLNAVDPVCIGDSSGQIQIGGQGGNQPYAFRWADGSTGPIRSGLPNGNYQVVVTDAKDCISDTLTVPLRTSSAIDLIATVSSPLCVGRSDGQIDIQPVGSAPFRYLWSRGDTTSSLGSAIPGSYSLRLTDVNGCLLDTSFQVQALSEPIQPVFNLVQPQCEGTVDGRISVTISGTPQQPLQYQWNDGQVIKDRQRIGEGEYQLTITDALGCIHISDTLSIISPDPVIIELAGQGEILCRGDSNGFLELEVYGGIAPYSYTWIGTSDTTPSAYNLSAGAYRIFVSDNNGCPAQASFQIDDPPSLETEVTITQGNICIGDSSNSLQLHVEGGVGPYNFSWNTGSMASALENVAPGAYSATVSDANGCQNTIPAIKLKDPGDAFQLAAFQGNDVSCFGKKDGSLDVSITGGTAPYRYVFSNATLLRSDSNMVRLTGLAPGSNYTVTVIDQNGCVIESAPVSLSEPTPLNSRRLTSLPNICFGGKEGSIFTSVQGGTAPYQYTWYDAADNLISTQSNLTQVGAGTYLMAVEDAQGCVDTLFNLRVEEKSSPLQLADTSILVPNCRGESTGSIRIQLAGGTPPYQYMWSTGSTSQNLLNVPAGTYQLQVTDSDTCRTQFSGLFINEPPTFISVTDSLNNPSCPGNSDGLITTAITGGVPPYALTWDRNGEVISIDTNQISGLEEGVYTLQVIDDNQCRKQFGFQLFDPDTLNLDFIINAPSPDQSDGRITAVVRGGTPEYNYNWSTGDTLSVLDSLSSGRYTLTVTDKNGCTISQDVQLVITHIQDQLQVRRVAIFPNPFRDLIQIDLSLYRMQAIDLQLYDMRGGLIYQEARSQAPQHQMIWDMSRVPTGSYQMVIRSRGVIIYSGKVIKLGTR